MTTMRPRESRARDGFIKNFDHRQMGSRMEALVYSETHDDEEEKEIEKIEEKKQDERVSVGGGAATQRPLKLLAIYLRNSPLSDLRVYAFLYRVYQNTKNIIFFGKFKVILVLEEIYNSLQLYMFRFISFVVSGEIDFHIR